VAAILQDLYDVKSVIYLLIRSRGLDLAQDFVEKDTALYFNIRT
jgi:hypothetical protein